MKKIEKTLELGGRTLKLSTGDLAQQASGAVLASYGETVVLATIVSAPLRQQLDYFPLSVDYMEKLYAGGRIKGSRWVKREGKPTDDEILTSRLIDRSIRPLFYKGYARDVQVVVTVLSVDLENSPEVLAAIATSAAVAVSPIPWQGPVSVVKVGYKDEKYILNPTESQSQDSQLDLVVSLTKDAIVMIESGSNKVSEDIIVGGIAFAQKESQKILKLIDDFAKEVAVKKESLKKEEPASELVKQIKKLVDPKLKNVIDGMLNLENGRSTEYEEMLSSVLAEVTEDERRLVPVILEDLKKHYIRDMILKGKRPDGRKTDEIRPLSSKVSILPRTHGSGIFQRGQTQVLTITTLGAPSLSQTIESAEGEETKRYIHHYSMPPFSSGETGKMGSPNRREIGHGALAERALLPVIPSEDDFPYAIRVVSEVLSSNGSTSMASTCGSTLSLMDAGVPIEAPVGGIAMGLIIEDEKKYQVLTDIIGLEDFNGDMDFKVAGTKDGITALQLDVKTLKFTLPILEKALVQAKKARLQVLDSILDAIDKPRDSVSQYAPKIKIIHIPVDKIGELIGPGGKTIKRISAETGCQIDVDEDGTVFVSGTTNEELEAGIGHVEGITKVPVPGEIYDGTVKRIQPFGAFIEILPGKEGMVHVSDMSENYVKDPSEIVKIGDKIQVRVKEIDDMGRLNLSLMLDPAFDQRKQERRNQRRDNGGGGRNFQRNRDNRDRRDDRRVGDRKNLSSGPHFPTSRFFNDQNKKY